MSDIPRRTMIDNTSEISTLTLYTLCTVVDALSKAQSLDDVRAAVTPVQPLADTILAQVESGDITLTSYTQGIDTLIAALRLHTQTKHVTESLNQEIDDD